MKTISTILLIALFIGACTSEPNVDGISEVLTMIDQEFDKTAAANDLDGNIAPLTDDAIYMQPNGEVIKGKENIKEWQRGSFELFNFISDHVPYKIELNGDWAIVQGICKGSITPKAGGDPIPFNNKYLHNYRKQADGSWKLALSCWNSNQ